MEDKALNLDGILQNVMQNPEMLKSAMDLASRFSAGGGLSSLLSLGGQEVSSDKKEMPAEREALAVSPRGEVVKANDMQRHRKLIEALSLYVSEDKRDLFDLILKLFDIIEIANHIKH